MYKGKGVFYFYNCYWFDYFEINFVVRNIKGFESV